MWEYAFLDFKLRENVGGYAVDTNVCLLGLGLTKKMYDIRKEDVVKWFENASIIIYWEPVMTELLTLLGKRYRCCLGELNLLLDCQNVRIVRNNKKDVSAVPIHEKLKQRLKESAGKEIECNDALLLAKAAYEGSEIVSFDNGMNTVAFKYDIPLWDMRKEKSLPYKHSWKWREKMRDIKKFKETKFKRIQTKVKKRT
jgi:predicted nucleic acid-binding protein